MSCIRFLWLCRDTPRRRSVIHAASCVNLCSDAAVNLTLPLPTSFTIEGCHEDKNCTQKEICTYLSVDSWVHHVPQISQVSYVLPFVQNVRATLGQFVANGILGCELMIRKVVNERGYCLCKDVALLLV